MPDPRDDLRDRLRAAVAGWGLSPEDQSDVVEELALHLEDEYAERRARHGERAARERLLAQLADPALRDAVVRPRHRPVPALEPRGGLLGLRGLGGDVRYAVRSLRRSPALVAMAVLALALGIGLTTVMWGIIYGTLIRGLPYEDAGSIAQIQQTDPSRHGETMPVSVHDFAEYRTQQTAFEAFGAYAWFTATVSGDGAADHVEGARATAAALELTRVRPLLGRALRAADEAPDAPRVVVLSHTLWRDRYAADSAMVGRTVRIDGRPHVVVGVMPPGFAYPNDTRLWAPLVVDPTGTPRGDGPQLILVGRLRHGVTYEAAGAQLAAIARRLAAERPPAEAGARPVVRPFVRSDIPTRVYSLFSAMLGAVGLVFLVACANVANLLLDRAAHRSKEVGIRSALGASRGAVVRLFLVEALLIAGLAAVAGTVLARAGIEAFHHATVDVEFPFWTDIRLHPEVLAFVAGMAVLASLASGLLPALHSARADVNAVLKDQSLGTSGHRVGRLSRAIVVFEIALSSALLLAAGLMTRTILNLRAVDPGFRSADVLTARVALATGDTARRRAFYAALDEGLARLPGVRAATVGDGLPGAGWNVRPVALEGEAYAEDRDVPRTRHLAVSPGFFETFGVRVLRGRAIGDADRAGTLPVAVVSRRFVERHLAGGDPIGRRIRLGGPESDEPWLTVVGVMPTLYAASLRDPWPPEVLTAFRQRPRGAASIAVRVACRGAGDACDPLALAAPLRALVASIDRDVPVYETRSMDDAMAEFMWPFRVFGTLFVVFGVAALVLAAVGLYAVMAFSVGRRERELGIRIALGARRAAVVRAVFREGGAQLVAGLTVGLLLGTGIGRLGQAVLYEVRPGDPVVLALVAGVLAATGCAACLVPALRATRVDPVIALRVE